MTSKRYFVVEGSESAHCCFEATVVDTTKPTMFYRDRQHYESVCECFDRAAAELIATALNASDGPPLRAERAL